jgi:hypothetical protein
MPWRRNHARARQKKRTHVTACISQDLNVGQAGGIIDGHVDELPADAADLMTPVAGDAMADPPDAPELLDVEVDELAGLRVLVAHHRGGRLERPQPGEPLLPQIAGDGRGTHGQGVGDLGARPPLPSQPIDQLPQLSRDLAGAALRATGAVGQPGRLAGSGDPLAPRPFADPEGGSDPPAGLVLLHDAADNLGSTLGRGPGILVNVHPSLRGGGELGSTTTSYPLVARMNNLLTLHS